MINEQEGIDNKNMFIVITMLNDALGWFMKEK